jgi:hypothetical protein
MPFYRDNANYTIDLDDLYSKWIKHIDGYRGNNYISGIINENNIYTIDSPEVTKGDPPPVLVFNDDSSYAFKESRCHAFYRILGMPVIDNDNFFNPGYDSNTDNIENKIKISNNFTKTKCYITSNDRNLYLNQILSIFSRNESIGASVLALVTKNPRKFDSCMNNPEKNPLEIESKDCKYNVSTESVDGKDMMTYVNLFNRTALDDLSPYIKWFGKNATERYHFIMPFVVDPRASFAAGDSNHINVPFFIFDGKTPDTKIQYPAAGLQQICIDRLSSNNQKEQLSDYQKSQIDYIKQVTSTGSISLDSSDLNKIYTNTNASGNTSVYYASFIGLAKKMMAELKKNVDVINENQRNYNLIPVPSQSGPEYGCNLRKILSSDPNNKDKREIEIVYLTAKNATNQIDILFNKIIKTSSLSENPFLAQLQSALGAITDFINGPPIDSTLDQKNLEQLNKARSNAFSYTNNALKYIEYIMGEFSGLGLCDVLVITSALYLIDEQVLISFFDDTAYARMQNKIFNLRTPLPERIGIKEALSRFSVLVKYLYSICDAIYLNLKKSASS